jgi:glycosyltransferase involved in cell wall biosynthesis
MRRSLLYIAVTDPHVPLSGTGTRCGEFVNHLAAQFDLDLVHMEGSGQRPFPEHSWMFADRLKGVREKRSIPFSPTGYFLFSLRMYRAAEEFLRTRRYDFIVCDYGLAAVYGLLLSKRFGVPFIYLSHNIEYMGYLDKARKDPRRLALAPYMYSVEKAAVQKCRVLVPITREDAAFYARWAPAEKMVTVPQGVDLAEFNPHYAPVLNHPKVVLFCANFKIQFNQDAVRAVMGRVLPRVLARRRDVRFRFVGAYPPRDVRHPNVEFMGFVKDYPALLKAADVVISPVMQGRGFPTKIIEALACGKQTVSTAVGARAVESDFSSLHVAGIDEFGAAICRQLDRGLFVTAQDFEKIKVRYSWGSIIQHLAERIEEAAGRPAGERPALEVVPAA